MTFIKQYLNAILGLVVLGLLVAGAFGVRAYNDSLREDGRAEIRAEWEAATNAALIERNREIARLITVNQGIQDAYITTDKKRQAALASAAESRRLLDLSEHDAAAAAATTGALVAHAGVVERNIAGLESDANKMADRAVLATANSEALTATLQARRGSLDQRRDELTVRRKALKPTE